MGLIVAKFGGSSVANADKIFHVAQIVTETYRRGNDVVVVVSAQGDTTDDLLTKAAEINSTPSRREMDMLLSTGEQISISLLAMAIEKLGCPVVSLTGWQAGFLTDSSHGRARIKSINTERVQGELNKRNIVVVAGFQGLNKYEDITTIGRGGSDTSAVALAAVLHADVCKIYTDVDGVYTADPRLVPTAKKLKEISFDEMLELSCLGAQVLQNRSVEMAKKYNINLEVLSSMHDVPGTIVKEVVKVEKMVIRGVAKDDNVVRISLLKVPDEPGVAYKVFSLLASHKIDVDIILQSVERDGTEDITFTVSRSNRDTAIQLLEEYKDSFGAASIYCDDSCSKVSVVGAGMQSHPGIAAKMFEALYEARINIRSISTSEIKISVLIDRNDAEKAVNVIHDIFFED